MSIILILCAYLLGSVSFAILTSKMIGLSDPRTYGSNNPGATNVLRSGNKLAAALTLLGDAGKGAMAVFLAQLVVQRYGLNESTIVYAGLAAFLGHLYPVWHGFAGGKGVATGLGVLLMYNWQAGLVIAAIWVAVFALSRVSSLSALLASFAAPIVMYLFGVSSDVTLATLVMSVFLIWRHQDNIKNLLAGTEGRFKK